MSFKACFGEDIRRFALPSPTFASLQEKISSLFAVRNPRITWRDVDGDVVTLATDDDLREALRTLSGEPNAALRVVVTESLDSATSVPVFPPTPAASAPTTVRVSAAAAAAVAAAREAAIPVVRETSRAASVSGSASDTTTSRPAAAAPTLTERVERMDIDDHAEPTPPPAAAGPAGSDPRDIPESPFAAEHAYDPEAAVAPIAAFVRSVLSGLANAGIEVEVVDDENTGGGAAAGPCGSADRCFGGACGTEPTGDSASSSTSAGAGPSASGTADEDVVHPGVVCDVCEGSIVGRRFKCTICPDFDLCMRCEATGAHADHPMVRLCRPGLRTRGHHPFGHGHFFGRRGGCPRRAWAHGCGPAGSTPEETPRGAAPTESTGEPGVSHPGHPHSHPHGAGHWHGARHGGHRGFQFGPFGFAFPPFPGGAPAAHPGAHAHPHSHPHPHGGPHGHPYPHSFPFGGFGRCGRGGFPWGGPNATAEVPRTQPAPTSTPTPPTPTPAPASAGAQAGASAAHAGASAAHAGAAAPTSSRAPSSPISDAAQLLREMGFEVDDASLRTVMQQFGGDIDSVIAHLCAN